MPHLQVQRDIEVVEQAISENEQQQASVKAAKEEGWLEELQWLREKEQQLRNEEEQLRLALATHLGDRSILSHCRAGHLLGARIALLVVLHVDGQNTHDTPEAE